MAPNRRQSDVEGGYEDGRSARTGGTSGKQRAIRASARRSRGQTTLDFAVGVSIFLLVVISVFLFIPGTIEPFTEGGQEEIITANRIADSLSEGLLGNPSNPHVLDTTCTVEFFKGNSPGQCRYEGNNLTERIGVKNRQFVNVTVESNGTVDSDGDDILCWDTDDGPTPRLVEVDTPQCDAGETRLTIGDSPPESSGTSVTARRIVEVNGTDATLLVEMW